VNRSGQAATNLSTLLVLLSAALCEAITFGADETTTNALGSANEEAHFTDRAPYSDATNITRHLGYTVELPPYSVTNESFRVLIPRIPPTNGSWGLLVWISPDDQSTIPSDWQSELSNHTLLFVSALHSGNSRHPLDRFRLALDAACNMCRRYNVDRRRIYIGGFSGGARMASMLGIGYGDIFTGTLCVCGVNFYTDLPISGGKYFPGTFVPDQGVLLRAKRSDRFVLLTGENDENRENTKSASVSGFKREGFRHVLYLEVPAMGHEMPEGRILAQALDYLDSQKD
jgi:predicted esterase